MANVSLHEVSGSGVRALTIDIPDREFFVLTGPRGCGASETLRMIAGLDPIASGEISIGGKRVHDLPPKERDIAMLFPTDTLYPRMPVSENMGLALKLRKFPQPEIKKRIAEAASILDLDKCLERRPAALSPSERFRVALGRAIVRQPKVFLFDEPLGRLDTATRTTMRAEILRLHHRLQATIIYATSDPVEAMTMANRVAVMQGGRLQQIGATIPVYQEPENLFVAGFLGAPPMNLVQGKLRESGDALTFKETGEGILEIKLNPRPEAKPFAGRDIVAGIRPEDIEIVTAPPRQGTPRFKALLDIVELMGAETDAHIDTGAHRIIARTPIAIPSEEAGHRVQFEIDPARVHLFDPETTRRIAAPKS